MDMTILADALAPVLRDLVADALAPVLRDLTGLKTRLDDLPPHATGQEFADLRKTYDELLGMVLAGPTTKEIEELRAALAAQPTVEQIAALVPTPQDGAPGRDADPAEIVRAVEIAVAALPRPQDGAPGRDGADGKDGVGVAGALIDREGSLVVTLTDGGIRELGPVVGKDGEAGADGRHADALDLGFDGERTLTIRTAHGEATKEAVYKLPIVIDRGVYKEGQTYEAGDAVTWGGSLWIARRETAARPETDDSWRLSVKKGRDGKDGELKIAREQAPVKLR